MDNIPNCMYDYKYEPQTPKVITECDICGYEIYEGEDYYCIYGTNICENCIDEFKKVGEL